MKFLPVLVFLVCISGGENIVQYGGYPDEIPIFQPDNYYCRMSLGMSYDLLGSRSSQPLRPGDKYSGNNPVFLSRLYSWYPTKKNFHLPNFCDKKFKLVGDGYDGYVEVPFNHVTVVDGIVFEGGLNRLEEITDQGEDSVWTTGASRYIMNYTTDGNEWLSYRNKEGAVLEFRLMEINRLDGVMLAAYTKLEPQVIARAVRFIFLSCRVKREHACVNLALELFGCEYEPENEGLQRGFKARSNMVIKKNTLYPWQLWGQKSGNIEPIQQPFLALSTLYSVGKNVVYPMPDGNGWCATTRNRQFVIDMLDGATFKLKHSPLKVVYPSKFVRAKDLWYGNLDYAADCFREWGALCAGYYQLKKRKLVNQRQLVLKHDGTKLRIIVDGTAARSSPCVQDISFPRTKFIPEKIKRSKGCNSLLKSFGKAYCHAGVTSYMAIDLKKNHILDSFSFRGQHSKFAGVQWVSVLTISYSPDAIVWLPVKERYASHAKITANRDSKRIVTFYLNPRLRARYLRIVPLSGTKILCLHVQIRGCSKEPWREEQQRVMQEARKIGFGMWFNFAYYKSSSRNKYFRADCFPGKSSQMKAKFRGTQRVTRLIYNQEVSTERDDFSFRKNQENTKILKCEARDPQGNVISRQLYIRVDKPGFLLPVQEIGLKYNGGLPILDIPGTLWTYEPYIGKLTFLFFPEMTYNYSHFGEFNKATNKLFHLTLLGKGRNPATCLNYAVHHHHRYFVIDEKNNECLSSWYLPLAAKPKENVAGNAEIKKNKVYKIYRVDQTRNPYVAEWRHEKFRIGNYKVLKEAPEDSPVFLTQPMGEARFRFHCDSYVTTNGYDSHTLVIKNFIQSDVAQYSLLIQHVGAVKTKYSRKVVLRHFSEPHLNLTLHTGACRNSPLWIIAEPIRREYQEAKEWDVEWMKLVNGKWMKTKMETSDPFKLYAKNAQLKHNGVYRIRVNNRYGFAQAFTYVEIIKQLPTISSVTSSPHTAVEDTSDVLQITVANDEDLTSVNWQFKGKPIELSDNHYSFPGALSGRPESRRILKLSNLHTGMNGIYKVTSKAKYCQFHKEIHVEVYVRPRMIASPSVRTIYQIDGGNSTEIKVVVTGGIPTPEIDNLVWYKNSKPLHFTKTGRVKINTLAWRESKTSDKRIGWNSTLLIRTPHEADSGTYSFMVSFPRANYTIERIIKVTKLEEVFA